jgi:1-acyl-sn-glycerol-3-phosphate acyltransferase
MKLPVIPAAICGTYDVLPRGRDRIRSAPVQVRLGEALQPDPTETEENLIARIWTAVSQLRGQDNYAREAIPLLIQAQRAATNRD